MSSELPATGFTTLTAMSGISMYAERARANQMSETQARKDAMELLRHQRYGVDGYISIVDGRGAVVMNPSKPEAEGKLMWDFQDKKGNYLYRDIVATGKSTETMPLMTSEIHKPFRQKR